MVRVLITEAHEGLGLALVKEYLADADNQVVAFCGDVIQRDRLKLLEDIVSESRLLVVDVNLADEESIKASVEPIEGFVDALDLLIFNVGFIPEEFFVHKFSDLPDDIFHLFVTKIMKSPQWLRDYIFLILKKGNYAKCVGMSLCVNRPHHSPNYLVDKGSPMMNSRSGFAFFTAKIDPNMVSVIHLSDLWREDILDRDTLDTMDNFEVFGQESINKKAKALYKNLSKLPHGKHIYMRVRHTGTYS